MNLTTASDLAKDFGITETQLHNLRRRNNWPCVKFGRRDVRFTDAQVEQILAIQSKTAVAQKRGRGGLTSRSAARAS